MIQSTTLKSALAACLALALLVKLKVDDTRVATARARAATSALALTNAEAEIPPPPDSATLAMRVALDAIPLDVRLECSPPNAQGIRAGSITASAPRWAYIQLDHVEQSPDLCASPALIQSARRTHGRFIPLILSVGATVATHGASGWGLFLGAGIAL